MPVDMSLWLPLSSWTEALYRRGFCPCLYGAKSGCREAQDRRDLCVFILEENELKSNLI